MKSAFNLALAGTSWVMLTLALLLPLALGANPDALVYASAFVVGIQAAQSAYIQIAPRWAISILPAAAFYLLAAGLASVSLWVSGPFALAIVGTSAGAALGLPFGAQALRTLDERGGLSYQTFQVARSFGVIVGVLIFALTWPSSTGFAAVLLVVMSTTVGALTWLLARAALGRRGTRTNGHDPHRPEAQFATILLALGLAASLFYRNDTNWLRASLASSPDFDEWHVALVAYSAIQGLVGFLVIQRLLSNRAGLRPSLAKLVGRWRVAALISWPLLGVMGTALSSVSPVYVAVVISSILAIGVGMLSGAAHVLVLNWAPYIAGVLGTLSLLGLLALGVDPRVVLCVSNSIIGLIVLIILAWRGVREWRS